MENIIIKLKQDDITEFRSLKKAEIIMAEKGISNGYIFIECENISDLFIVKNEKVKRCNDEEWNNYYYTYINEKKYGKFIEDFKKTRRR